MSSCSTKSELCIQSPTDHQRTARPIQHSSTLNSFFPTSSFYLLRSGGGLTHSVLLKNAIVNLSEARWRSYRLSRQSCQRMLDTFWRQIEMHLGTKNGQCAQSQRDETRAAWWKEPEKEQWETKETFLFHEKSIEARKRRRKKRMTARVCPSSTTMTTTSKNSRDLPTSYHATPRTSYVRL